MGLLLKTAIHDWINRSRHLCRHHCALLVWTDLRGCPGVKKQLSRSRPDVASCFAPFPRRWADLHLISFSLVQWRRETGIHPHPGPPNLTKRLRKKQHVPETSQPLHQHQQQQQQQAELQQLTKDDPRRLQLNPPQPADESDPQWYHLVEQDMKEQMPSWDLSHGFMLESKNVTCLATHEEGMVHRAARVSVLQEHSLPPAELKRLKHRLRTQHAKQLVAGPTEPGNLHNAGVGAIAGTFDTLFEFIPITAEFKKIRNSGRVIHMGFGMGKGGVIFSIFNIYGVSGGAHDPKKARITSRILRAIIQEAFHFAANPKIITGDINGDFDSFPELEMLCESMGWQDLNAIATTWGQPSNAPTCRTALSHQPTIRDYCLVCPITLPMVMNFRVLDADLCPVHSTLQIHIVPPTADTW